jgi:hypothetical protein
LLLLSAGNPVYALLGVTAKVTEKNRSSWFVALPGATLSSLIRLLQVPILLSITLKPHVRAFELSSELFNLT